MHFIIFSFYIFYVPSPLVRSLGQEDNKKQFELVFLTCATNGLLTTYELDKAQLGWTAGAGGLKSIQLNVTVSIYHLLGGCTHLLARMIE